MTNIDYIISHIHYKPNRLSAVCGCMKYVFKDYPNKWQSVKSSTDISKVTCDECVIWILDNLKPLTPAPTP